MIGGLLQCISFIWDYRPGTVLSRTRGDVPSLPDDVLIDILSRLPADYLVKFRFVCRRWKQLISSPGLVRLQLRRASPALLVQYRIGYTLQVGVVGETAGENSNYKLIRVDSQDERCKSMPKVNLCCDGVILLKTCINGVKYFFLFNPVTYEKVAVAPKPRAVEEGDFRGFFFHPGESEYKLLLADSNQEKTGYLYFIYSTGTRTWRQLALRNYSCLPSKHASHVTLNGALHWIVEHDYRNNVQPCENAIMVYNIDTENFLTIAHPGHTCFLTTRHHNMYLFETERKLCFCNLDLDGGEVVHVWILTDYANLTWLSTYRVWLDGICRAFRMEIFGFNTTIKLLNMWKDELFLDWKNIGILRIHPKKQMAEKINCRKVEDDIERVYSGAFTKSLVTLV